MENYVMPLVSAFMGKITFPHYLKYRRNGDVFLIDVLMLEDEPVLQGQMVAIEKNVTPETVIYKVTSTTTPRTAKGDWSSFDQTPVWSQLQCESLGQLRNIPE